MKGKTLSLIVSVCLGLALAILLALATDTATAGTTATTHYVATDGTCGGNSPCYATIQAAVDAAARGDTILVAKGTYTGVSAHGSHTQVVYLDKSVTIRGGYTTAYAEPPDPIAHPTTLDAESQGHVVYVPTIGSSATPTLEGLRLTGGYASEGVSGDDTGGGLRVDGTSGDLVTVRNCWIGNNTAEGGGAGGIGVDFDRVQIIDSTVISNTGTGVILWESDSPVLSGNTIAGNSAGGVTILTSRYGNGLSIQGNDFIGNTGNGIYLDTIESDGGNDLISDNTFDGNDRGLFAKSIYYTSLRIHNNTFHNNTNNNPCYHYDIYGGGLRLEGVNAEVLNDTFTGNYACYGGGLSVGNGGGNTVLIQGNTFLSNSAGAGMGGAIHLEGEGNAANVQGNLISGNQAHDGGGLSIDVGAQPTVRRNVVTGNQVAGYGGALYCGSCTVTLEQNRITGNSAGTGGGLAFGWPAVAIPQTVSTLINNLIADNSAATGSGVAIKSSNLVLIHNTIAHNLGGAGVHVERDLPTSAVLTNTILVSHTVGIQLVSGSASLQGTLWGDGAWANGSDWGGAVVTGTVNYWGDPLFVDPGHGDYHISASSPARDRGVDAGIHTDLDGESRPHPDTHIPDIGADEYHLDDARVFLPLVMRSWLPTNRR
jgi:parallel beta-helix repeat protein/predicted outer membrane repeat protein